MKPRPSDYADRNRRTWPKLDCQNEAPRMRLTPDDAELRAAGGAFWRYALTAAAYVLAVTVGLWLLRVVLR